MNRLNTKPYNALSDRLKERYGQKVFKVTLDAGFTCPNRDGTKGTGGCIYCESSTLKPNAVSVGQGVSDQLLAGMDWVRKRHRAERFIAYFQINTNTHAPIEDLAMIYGGALHPDVVAVAISTRPDCLDDRVLDLISEIKRTRDVWLELGLQSANDLTLKALNRAHTAADFIDAVERARLWGLDVCAHVILGLPGESVKDNVKTMRLLAGLGVWGVKFHQLQVIKGTRLEELYTRGNVRVLALEEYVNLVIECLERLPAETVIHRLSGDVPARFLVAPRWSVNKFIIAEKILSTMRSRHTRQGAKFMQEG